MKGARRASICSWMSGVNDVVSSLNQGGSDLSKGGGIEMEDFFLYQPTPGVNSLTITGSTLRARPDSHKAAIAVSLKEHVWPLLASGKVGVVMDSTFPLAKAADAHRRLETSEHVGKIVLVV